MNHGGMGVLEHLRSTRGSRILFKADILQTLSIVDKSTLEGVYYPGRRQSGVRQTTTDFVFSPIPFRFWPIVGRIRVRLLSSLHVIQEFSAFLARNGVSVLHSEYSRSGYRFATWNFVVSFNVEVRDNDFNKEETAYQPTLNELNSLTKKMQKEAAHLIFEDKDDVRFRDAFDIWPITPLAYFYNFSKRCKTKVEHSWLCEPFYAECTKNQLVFSKGNRFSAILGVVSKADNESKLSVYGDISTTDVLLRVAVLTTEQESKFSKLAVEYVRNSPPDTSRGFCAHITRSIPKGFKIWKMTNYTRINNDFCEIGGANLILEDQRNNSQESIGADERDNEILSVIQNEKFCVEGGEPFDLEATLTKFDSTMLWNELKLETRKNKEKKKRWDVFLSYSERDSELAMSLMEQLEGSDLTCFMAKKSMKEHIGEDFSDRIRESILSSEEMVLLCSPDAIKSEWVISEWASAWILGKMITPVLYQLSPNDLPLRLQSRHCVHVHAFSDFVRAAAIRKQLR